MVAKINFRIETELVSQRTLNQISNAAWRETMTNYRNKVLPKRFEGGPETAPGGALGFAPRSQKYNERKRRKFGHTIPLRRRGQLKNDAVRRSTVAATAKRATLTIKAYFSLNSDRLRELETMTPQMVDDAGKEYADLVVVGINDKKNHKKRIHQGKVATLG